MPRVFLPQILWHSKDNKRCDRVYSIDFQPNVVVENEEKQRNSTTLRLATGGADEFVHIWQITIQDHTPQYTHFVNNPENSDSKTEFEQPISIKILARLTGHIGEVNSVKWSHSGRILASGGEDRCIFLWVKGSKQNSLNEDVNYDYEEYWTRTHYFRLSNVVNTICWCPEDRVLSVSTEDGHVSIVDTQVEGSGRIRYFDGHTSFAQGVSLDPTNELLASLGSDQCLRVWKRRNQKRWKSVLVLKAARDRGDLIPVNELENNVELRRHSRIVFMSEEVKTFFRRLDWSPDGRLLVTPTGIRHDKNNTEDNGSEPAQDSTVYTLYIFHRKLLNYGIPMLTHQSPTGPFVVVKFCPINLSLFDKKRQNFYNLLLNAGKNKLKPVKKKVEKTEKQPLMTNKINTYFTTLNRTTSNTDSAPTNPVNLLNSVNSVNPDKPSELGNLVESSVDLGDEVEPVNSVDTVELVDSVELEINVDNVKSQCEEKVDMDVDYVPTFEVRNEQVEENTAELDMTTNTTLDDYHSNNSTLDEAVEADFDPIPVEESSQDSLRSLSQSTQEFDQNSQQDVEHSQSGVKDECDVKAEDEQDKSEVGFKGEEVKTEVEDEESEKRVYNLRKVRRSVMPLLTENTLAVKPKREKSKVKKEKKVKSQEEVKEEGYDSDLEEELSIPRFIFAAGTTDGSLCFFDTNENSGPIAVLKNLHFCPITDISWSPDGYVCASSSSDGYITFVIFNKRELS